MIDIADFAVGQSRMLYGLTMHSERPQHRMYEQWHPLGVVGIISRVQFPGGGVGLECVPRRHLRQRRRCGSPRPRRRSCAIAVQHICNRVMREHKLPPIFQLFIDAGTELADALRRRPARRAGVVHRLDGRRPQRRRARRAPARQDACSSSAATTRSSSTRSANLELAVPAIVFGAVGTAGQRCTTHAARARASARASHELEKRLAHAYTQVRIGDPLDAGTLMGPLIDTRRGRALLAGHRSRREAAGGKVLVRRQGARRARATSSQPTIVRARERLAHRAARDLRARSCT